MALLLKQLLLIPTNESGYQNMYQRSYDVAASYGDVNALAETIHQTLGSNGTSSVPINLLAQTVPGVVKLTFGPTYNTPIAIENGWGTARLRFLLTTEEEVNGQTRLVHFQGYTNYPGYTASGNIDPEMNFSINSVMIVNKIMYPTGEFYYMPSAHYNVITRDGEEMYQEVDNPTVLIRPLDVVSSLRNESKYGGDAAIIHDFTNTTIAGPMGSSRLNNDAMSYLSKALNGYITGKSLSDRGSNQEDIYNAAIGQVSEPILTRTEFIQHLFQVKHILNATSFKLKDLALMDNTIESRLVLINKNSSEYMLERPAFTSATDTMETLTPIPETMRVLDMVNSLNALMSANLLSKLGLSITNETGELLVAPIDLGSYVEGIDMRTYADRVVQHFTHVVYPRINPEGRLLRMLFYSELMGDTSVSVSFDNEPDMIYRFPTFADSLFSPVITTPAYKEQTTDSFSSLFDATYPGMFQNNVIM